ncbi:MAG: C40 family peptidase [Pseudonocardiaceae bacterium]
MANRLNRTARGIAAVALVAALLSALSVPAVADPVTPPAPPPADPIAATVAQVHELSRQAEVLTEQWHLAKDRLQSSRAAADRARSDVASATAGADQARAAQDEFRGQVDRLTSATFQGVRISSVTAVLISDSPEEFLDQMFALDVLAVSSKEVMARLAAAVARAEEAELVATDAETRAAVAELDAARITDDVAKASQQMGAQIGLVQARLGELTVDELARYASEGFIDFPIEVQGAGVGAAALRAALTRQGAPYIWGAEGPGAFDCSGLVSWAYRQAGVILPRSSWQQARVGTPVVSGLKPGDLIALYQPVSHIGMYVGDGLYVNAPQAGDVVKVARVPWHVVMAVRRIE